MLAEESMNYIFKIIFFTFFSTLFSYQTTTLKGVVLDEENNPINILYYMNIKDKKVYGFIDIKRYLASKFLNVLKTE